MAAMIVFVVSVLLILDGNAALFDAAIGMILASALFFGVNLARDISHERTGHR